MNSIRTSSDASAAWRLDPPFSSRHLLISIIVMVVLFYTGSRVEIPRMVSMLGEAVGTIVGINESSQVTRGLSRISESLWPIQISDRQETSRIENYDRAAIVWPARVEVQEDREVRLNTTTLQTEETVTSKEFVYNPIGYLNTVLLKMVETLEIALWGTIIAVLVSIPLAYFAAVNYAPNRFAYSSARSGISLLRSIPEVISALFLVLAFGFGPIAGILALGLHGAGFLGKFYAEDIENADKGPQEALRAIGSNRVKVLWYSVLPQVFPQYIAYTLYILDRNVRMATVIGIVGAGGIGQELKGRFEMFQYGHVGTILLVIFLTVCVLDQISARLRIKMI